MATVEDADRPPETCNGRTEHDDEALLPLRTFVIIVVAAFVALLAGLAAGLATGIRVGATTGVATGVLVGVLTGVAAGMFAVLAMMKGLHALVGTRR